MGVVHFRDVDGMVWDDVEERKLKGGRKSSDLISLSAGAYHALSLPIQMMEGHTNKYR